MTVVLLIVFGDACRLAILRSCRCLSGQNLFALDSDSVHYQPMTTRSYDSFAQEKRLSKYRVTDEELFEWVLPFIRSLDIEFPDFVTVMFYA